MEKIKGKSEWVFVVAIVLFSVLVLGFIVYLLFFEPSGFRLGAGVDKALVSSDGGVVQLSLNEEGIGEDAVADVVFTKKGGEKYYYRVDVEDEIEVAIEDVVSNDSELEDFNDIEEIEIVVVEDVEEIFEDVEEDVEDVEEEPIDVETFVNVYYVDKGHGLASDSNFGTEDSPWLSIGHAEGVASAGDLVVVKSGDYTSEGILVIRGSGTAGNKITFRGKPSRQAKVQGFYTRGNNIRIEGFEITNDMQGYDADGIFIRSSNVDIVDNYIHDISATGIDSLGSANADNIYIANNYMNTVGAGMYINGDNWIVENNEIERLYLGSAGIDADYTRFFGNNHIIRNNYFHGSIENEVEPSHTDCFQTYNADGKFAHGIIIEGNICTGYYRQGVIANGVVGGLTNFTIRNNIFAGNGRNAWGISGRNVRDVTIVNNVISNFMHYGIGITEGADNAIVKNNILYNSGGNAILLEGTNAEHSYNIIFGGGRITPAGTNNIIGEDPLFVDVANYNFRLRSNSPARNAGTDTSEYGVTRDIDGVSRPQGSGYDIGVYEY